MTGPLLGGGVELRPFEPDDADAVLAYLNHPELAGRRHIPNDRPDVSLTAADIGKLFEKWSQTDRQAHFAVVEVSRKAVVGHASANWRWDAHSPEVEIAIDPEAQRRGLGSTGFRNLVGWLFDSLPAHNIGCWTPDWNEAGKRFLRKNGFSLAGVSRREGFWRGRFVDMAAFDVLRPEWEARDAA